MLVNKEFAAVYYSILDKLNPDTTIEIGAYDAEFSQHMASKINPNKVWALEALPNIYNNFKNELKHINYVNLAISDTNDTVIIGELDPDKNLNILSGASSILTKKNNVKTTPVSVNSMTVDTLANKNNIKENIALWIDCEGANKEVLTGAIDTLTKTVAVYIEVELTSLWNDQWLKQETIDFLRKHNFTLIKESETYWNVQQDLIFVKNTLLHLLDN